MKWISGETCESEVLRKTKWHKWFAWYPVIVGQVVNPSPRPNEVHYVKCWLCYVERKGKQYRGYTFKGFPVLYWRFEYREIEKKEE